MITCEMEMAKFNARLVKFMAASNIATDKILRKTAFDLLANIIRPYPNGTHPVDTGRARAGWYASMKGLGLHNVNLSSGLKSNSKVSIGKREGKYKEFMGLTKWDKGIEMINGVNYILYLEYGHSKQAPYGMVRISIRKMKYSYFKNMEAGLIEKW